MKSSGNSHRIAIIGCGTVGGATAKQVINNEKTLNKRSGLDIQLKYIVDKDFTNAKRLGLPEKLYETSIDKAISDQEVDIIIELIGGKTFAKQVIEQAIDAGKAVVTANKALLATDGPELMERALKNNTVIAFEASCAGGIPIVRALYDGLVANSIEAMYGIVNGTCNFILSEMVQKGQTFSEALGEAQATGLAEADPTLDISGEDSAHKLAILGSLAFGQKMDFDSIPVEGINKLELMDLEVGSELGYIIKLLAIAKKTDNGISLFVRPVFIHKDHPLAWVSGSFNAISVYGDTVGHTMYYGRGAGGAPTASAIVSDIVSTAQGTLQERFKNMGIWPDRTEQAKQLPSGENIGRFYIRMIAHDQPGVLAGAASILAKHNISISSVLQKEPEHTESGNNGVPVVITTHIGKEGNVRNALQEIDNQPYILEKSVCIHIVDEHEENLPD